LTITDLNGGAIQTGDFLRASIAGVTDPNNVSATNPTGAITGDIRYTWQAEFTPGSGVFDDIILLPGGDLAFESASGAIFRALPLVDGLSLRVKAIYEDAHGVTEQVFSAPTAPVVATPVAPPATPAVVSDATAGGEGAMLVRSDLDFILKQIKIAEAHVAGTPLQDLIPNIRLAYGLRSVDGSENNLLHQAGFDQADFGAADTTFPRLLTPVFQTADVQPAGFFGPGSPAGTTPTSYAQTSGFVFDSDPRTISNLIVDQTANNPAAAAAAAANPGAGTVISPGLDGLFGTPDDTPVYFIPNVKPDFGLTAPFNALMTFFGQFFDHGLDLVTKGGSGTVFIPLQPDDPLYIPGSPTNFMVETRATNLAVHPGPDGVLGTSDDIHDNENTTTPFVDQNQTYTPILASGVPARLCLDLTAIPSRRAADHQQGLGRGWPFRRHRRQCRHRDRRHGDVGRGEAAGARHSRHQSHRRRLQQCSSHCDRSIRQHLARPERLRGGHDEGRGRHRRHGQ
jgi:hypothetical protein